MYDPTFMKAACMEARQGILQQEGGPFGCVIVDHGTIIGRGHNTVVRDLDCTCHGEINAIRDACRLLSRFHLDGCEMYTSSEPCPMCLAAAMWAHIEKIYYSCNCADAMRIGFNDWHMDASLGINRDWMHEHSLLEQRDKDMGLEVFGEYLRLPHVNY